MTDSFPQKVELTKGLGPMPALQEAKQPMVPWARTADPEEGEQPGGSVFNRGSRPVQDAGFGALYLGLMLLLLLRELWVFFWPVASLSLLRSLALGVPPLLAIALGLLLTLPATFRFLWVARGVTASHVRIVLAITCVLSFLAVVPLIFMLVVEAISMFEGERQHLFAVMVSIPPALLGVFSGGCSFYILYYHQGLLPLVALAISDTAKFVLTRGRGLLLGVLALTAAAFSLSVPFVSIATQLATVCPSPGDAQYAQAEVSPAQQQLCKAWRAALDTTESTTPTLDLSAFFALVGFFWACWSAAHIYFSLQFIAAHVVGQYCGSTWGTAMEEDGFQAVIAATKVALYESFGTIARVSLVFTVSFPAITVQFYLGLFFMPFLFPCLIPLLAFLALPAFSLFLSWTFLLPMAAFTGQSFSDAWRSSAALLQQVTVSQAGAFLVSSTAVVRVILLIVLAITSLIVGFLSAILQALGAGEAYASSPSSDSWLAGLVPTLAVGACSIAFVLFHGAFNAAFSSVYLGLAMEGKAVEGTDSTPLVAMNA